MKTAVKLKDGSFVKLAYHNLGVGRIDLSSLLNVSVIQKEKLPKDHFISTKSAFLLNLCFLTIKSF